MSGWKYGRHELAIKNNQWLTLTVSPGTTRENREQVLTEWYRTQLKERIPALIAKWEEVGGECRGLGCETDENEVGELQHRGAADLVELGASQEAARVP